MFYIRADGNEKIGMGHIMRCLTIADALKKRGEEVIFITADEKPAAVIKEKGFAGKVLASVYDDMETELPELMTVLGKEIKSGVATKLKILVDSYFITHHYLEKLGEKAKVILMDDEKKAVYPCDALVDYNIFGKTLGYENDYPKETKLFLGCSYAPLREEFRNSDYNVRETVKHILFTTGGSDTSHMALAMAKRLTKTAFLGNDEKKEQKTPIWHIVCGPYCLDTEELEHLAAKNDRLQIHKNVTHMSELMKRCDIAVSAAGSTLYELCSIGIPTVGFYVAENQQKNIETFAELTPVKNAGNYVAEPEQVLDFIETEVERLCGEKALRKEMSRIMQTIVDGQGAERLVEAFLSI